MEQHSCIFASFLCSKVLSSSDNKLVMALWYTSSMTVLVELCGAMLAVSSRGIHFNVCLHRHIHEEGDQSDLHMDLLASLQPTTLSADPILD